ncbi:MAG: DUF2849 domain-containing protein [Rhodospirillales bacterium]|nr:DUF2849 domain-containing protein [Rhodospirillales bacterium]
MKNVWKPQIVTANRLTDGAIVYLAGDGNWTRSIGRSLVANSEREAEEILATANAAVTACQIVGPYLIEVSLEGGVVRPVGTREWIRAQGPTVHPEFATEPERAAA